MRLVNGAIDRHWKFSIDNHSMTVIAAHFIPITPYETTVLDIGMGGVPRAFSVFLLA